MRVLFRAMGDSISHDGLAAENDLPHADLAVLLPRTLRSSSVVARSRPTSTNISRVVRVIERLERTLSSRTALWDSADAPSTGCAFSACSSRAKLCSMFSSRTLRSLIHTISNKFSVDLRRKELTSRRDSVSVIKILFSDSRSLFFPDTAVFSFCNS